MKKDFYYKSIEFYFQTKKLSVFETKELNHPFLKEIPKHLYKYRKSGEDGRIDFYVGKRNIYTASFNNLNDIFEGITSSTKRRISKFDGEAMCKYYRDTIINILINRFPSIDNKLAETIFDLFLEEHFDTESIFNRVKEFVDEGEQKELRTVISSLTYIFEGLDTKMNDNSEFNKGMQLLMNINDYMGAFCMCDSYSNENLWALYADEFRGYCIEYDLTNPCKSKGSIRFISSLYPVSYVDKKDDDWFKPLFESTIATINIDGKGNKFNSGIIFHHWMIKTLCSKKKDRWSNENEWRAIGKANSAFLGPLVSSIIVGHNINKTDFERITMWANKNNFELKITDIDYDKQEVMIRGITQEDINKIMKRE